MVTEGSNSYHSVSSGKNILSNVDTESFYSGFSEVLPRHHVFDYTALSDRRGISDSRSASAISVTMPSLYCYSDRRLETPASVRHNSISNSCNSGYAFTNSIPNLHSQLSEEIVYRRVLNYSTFALKDIHQRQPKPSSFFVLKEPVPLDSRRS